MRRIHKGTPLMSGIHSPAMEKRDRDFSAELAGAGPTHPLRISGFRKWVGPAPTPSLATDFAPWHAQNLVFTMVSNDFYRFSSDVSPIVAALRCFTIAWNHWFSNGFAWF